MHCPTLVRFFTATALLFGAVFVFLVPPFQSPDEYNHFFRAYQLSEGHFIAETLNGNRLGGTLPGSLLELKSLFSPLKNNYKGRTGAADFKTAKALRLEPGQRQFIDFPNTAVYAPLAYLPQALGIALARLFSERVLVLFYAARLANLAVWIALVVFAIRTIPFYRAGLAVLALLPASLAIAASVNADVVTNGLSFWLVAVFCSQARRLNGLKLAGLAAVSWTKLVLFPLALLTGLSAFRRFSDWKSALRKSWFSLLLAAAVAGIWGKTAGEQFIPYDQYNAMLRDEQTLNPGVHPGQQLARILSNPLEFAGVVVRSGIKALPSAGAHLVGKFGWEKNYLPAWVIALLWAGLAAIGSVEVNPLSRAQRCWLGLIVVFSVLLWATTMYALWRPVGSSELDNWQGRYFVPLTPLVLLAFGNAAFHHWRPRVEMAAAVVLVLGNIVLVWSICQRYYS